MIKARHVVVYGFTALALLAGVGGLAANLADQQRALVRAGNERTAALQRSAAFDAQAATQRDEEARDHSQAAAIAARIQAAEAEVQAGLARIDVIEMLRRRQRARLAEKQEPVVKLIAALELMARRPPALAFVQPGSVRDMVHMRAVYGSILPVISARTADLRAEVARGVQLRTQADLALAALKASQAQLGAQQNALAANAASAHAHADALTSSALVEQDHALAMSEKAKDITSLMAGIQVDAQVRDQLAALPGPMLRPANLSNLPTNLPAAQLPGPPPALNYRLPVIGEVTTGLGEETVPGVRSRGLTIATQPNALVVAPSGGIIAYAGAYRGFGNIIIIDHGHGLTTLITNLARLDVRVGDTVIQGSPLGNAGGGGGSDQPSITVELRRGGVPVDITPLVA